VPPGLANLWKGTPEEPTAVLPLNHMITGNNGVCQYQKVSALEREIDKLVYALYGLAPEEIEIVEGKL